MILQLRILLNPAFHRILRSGFGAFGAVPLQMLARGLQPQLFSVEALPGQLRRAAGATLGRLRGASLRGIGCNQSRSSAE